MKVAGVQMNASSSYTTTSLSSTTTTTSTSLSNLTSKSPSLPGARSNDGGVDEGNNITSLVAGRDELQILNCAEGKLTAMFGIIDQQWNCRSTNHHPITTDLPSSLPIQSQSQLPGSDASIDEDVDAEKDFNYDIDLDSDIDDEDKGHWKSLFALTAEGDVAVLMKKKHGGKKKSNFSNVV
jgi:hypothetical protein